MDKVTSLIGIYKSMTDEQRQDEIDALFEIVYAILECCECDSIESFPNVNIRLKISCEVIKNDGKYYC